MNKYILIKLFLITLVNTNAQNTGQCKSTSDCKQYGDKYSCVSVQTSYPGLLLTSQCVAGNICSGNIPGNCPTFNSWSSTYQKIQPVCVFTKVSNCNNNNNNNTVTCYNINSTEGIYKCIDIITFKQTNTSNLNINNCQVNNTIPDNLCNGHGTCSPDSVFSTIYKCICNKGYSSTDTCKNPSSNSCNSFGSCGSGNTCSTITGVCECSSDKTGNQCSLCNSNSTNACNGNGKCNSDGSCTCNKGYTGKFCGSNTTSFAIAFVPLTYMCILTLYNLILFII